MALEMRPENYAESFGFQWNRFARTQLDEEGGDLSRERFFSQTRWPRSLPGEVVVEAGCRAGRFTPHPASPGARAFFLDYSYASVAAQKNNQHLQNGRFLPGDLRCRPFEHGLADLLL